MITAAVNVEPAQVGLSAARLMRIDHHFSRLVDAGRLVGWFCVVARRGHVAHVGGGGYADPATGTEVGPETIWRIFSMTKPVVAAGALMLWEEAALDLRDPVGAYLPAFEEMQIHMGGPPASPDLVATTGPIRIWHLLTHTAGLTYGFHHAHPVDAMYRSAGFDLGTPPGVDLAGCCDRWASLPLLFEPGTEWNYSVASDVLGRVIEVVSGQPLDVFLAERIFAPLAMHDTGFWVPRESRNRLAALYVVDPESGVPVRDDTIGDRAMVPPDAFLGGSGLVSTAGDYLRFAESLRGGELDDVRLLGVPTVRLMTTNHLPGGADLEACGRPLYPPSTFDGVGYGLGVSVLDDPARSLLPGSLGEFGWSGAASTLFWCDPVEEITVVFCSQLLPSTTLPLRADLRKLVYQAVTVSGSRA